MKQFKNLTQDEVVSGVMKMVHQLNIGCGSVAGQYDLYEAVVGEWEKSKKTT